MRRLMLAVCLLVAAFAPAQAAGHGCSFKKTLQQGGFRFDVASRPVAGCAVQVIEVAVRQGGKTLARLKSDVDFLAEAAWAVDLDDDGQPELAVASRSVRSDGRGTFDVYRFRDNSLHRATLAVNDEGLGYRGHDRFRLEGQRIERSFPVYRDADPDDRPSGGNRSLLYRYREGRIVNIKAEEFTDTALVAPGPAPTAADVTDAPPGDPEAPSRPVIEGIDVGRSSIDIRANGRITAFKLLRLSRPARLAIDIPHGRSAMAEQVVAIGQNGIKRARIGANPGYLRIVLDATAGKFPAQTVTATETGLRIGF